MHVSSLPEIYLFPEDMQAVIELVTRHDSNVAVKLNESYQLARFDVFDNPERVRFMCHDMSREEAVQIQHWIRMERLSAGSDDAAERLTRLSDEWLAVSAEVE